MDINISLIECLSTRLTKSLILAPAPVALARQLPHNSADFHQIVRNCWRVLQLRKWGCPLFGLGESLQMINPLLARERVAPST